jgi:hypothetical protein
MSNEFSIIIEKLEKIEKDIEFIKEKLDKDIIKNSNKLNKHIDFIENVYDTVKSPFEYVYSKIFIGKKIELPAIKYKEFIIDDTSSTTK